MNWQRKKLKSNAKAVIKRNYKNIFIVSFLMLVLVSGYSLPNLSTKIDDPTVYRFNSPTLTDEIIRTLGNLGIKAEKGIEKFEDTYKLRNATEGVLASIINNSTNTSSFLKGTLHTVNQFMFGGKILENTLAIISMIVLFLYWLFVKNILIVGESRFFLEIKYNSETERRTIFFVYRIGKTLKIAKIMFLRFVYNTLWYLTIVGGIIKNYSYRMIPFIIAENPDIPTKDAFLLSKEMMSGNKWNTFKLDVSFLFWHLFSILTFGLGYIFYVNPFISTTNTELYYILREEAIAKGYELSKYFNDEYLIASSLEAIPVKDKHFKTPWVELDYEKKYSIPSLVMMFFVVSFIGWCWEVFLYIFSTGNFVNRGTLVGPWLPIYGTGALLIIIFLRKWASRPQLFFISIFLTCGVLEYFTSWFLETFFGQRWWEYSNVFFNINGRICLEGLIFFAFGGGMITYFIAPLIDKMFLKLSKHFQKALCIILIIIFAFDVIYSSQTPNTGEGVTASADKENID